MTSNPLIAIPARKGKAAYVAAGQSFKVINTHGQQVVDTWAFRQDDLTGVYVNGALPYSHW